MKVERKQGVRLNVLSCFCGYDLSQKFYVYDLSLRDNLHHSFLATEFAFKSTLFLVLACFLPRWLRRKVSAHNAGDPGSIPGLGRSPEEGNGNPLQYSCLENSMDGGAWWATYSPWGHKESDMTE